MEQGNEQGLEMSAHLTKEELDAVERCGPGWCGDKTFQRLCHMARAARASPVQPLGVLHQSPDGRVFKSFPSTDAPQAPSEAVAWTLGDDVILARFWTADYPPEGWQPLFAAPSAGTPEERE